MKAARLRLKPKITLAQIAEKFGVTPQAVHQWENDDGDPGAGRVLELAKFLKVPVLWLVGGEDTPPPAPDSPEIRFEDLPASDRAIIMRLLESLTKRQS